MNNLAKTQLWDHILILSSSLTNFGRKHIDLKKEREEEKKSECTFCLFRRVKFFHRSSENCVRRPITVYPGNIQPKSLLWQPAHLINPGGNKRQSLVLIQRSNASWGRMPLIIHFPRPGGGGCHTCLKNYYHLTPRKSQDGPGLSLWRSHIVALQWQIFFIRFSFSLKNNASTAALPSRLLNFTLTDKFLKIFKWKCTNHPGPSKTQKGHFLCFGVFWSVGTCTVAKLL